MSDHDLLQNMERLLELSENLPLTATTLKPVNQLSPLFRWSSSVVSLRPSPEMRTYRKNIIRTLRANNYSVSFERLVFLPHISIRLGVPYTKDAKAMTERSFDPGAKLTFSKWIILRDIKKDGKYLVKEIAPRPDA